MTDAAIAAARLANSSGMTVRVVVDRLPGAAAELRAAAATAGADVTVELTPTSVVGYFATGGRARRAQRPRSSEREPRRLTPSRG